MYSFIFHVSARFCDRDLNTKITKNNIIGDTGRQSPPAGTSGSNGMHWDWARMLKDNVFQVGGLGETLFSAGLLHVNTNTHIRHACAWLFFEVFSVGWGDCRRSGVVFNGIINLLRVVKWKAVG